MTYKWECQNSTRILWCRFNTRTLELTICFNDKKRNMYKYFSVPQSIAEKLCQAESPGKYFDMAIKPFYKSLKINPL